MHRVSIYRCRIPELVLTISSLVHPAHFGAALLSEGTGADGVASGGQNNTPLFTSVIQKTGGDLVNILILLFVL